MSLAIEFGDTFHGYLSGELSPGMTLMYMLMMTFWQTPDESI